MKTCSLSGTSAVWIPVEDTNASVLLKPANGTEFTLKELQTAVDGHVELVRLTHWWLVVNDESAINGSPLNIPATTMAGQPIFGDVLISPLPWIT